MLFFQDQYQYLSEKSRPREDFLVSQFANQEFKIKLMSQVRGRNCTVIGSLTAPADQALQLLMLLHTLSKLGATQLTLFSPYLGYQRQDAINVESSHGLQWADAMLYAAGVTKIITIDLHNQESLSTLKVPVEFKSSETFYEQEIVYFISLGFSFVFPDMGAVSRSRWMLEKYPTVSLAYFIKKRLYGIVELDSFQGKVSQKVMICDDILDSGLTLVQVCIALRALGVKEIVIFVTHAFFNGRAWTDLWGLGVKVLYCTNSVPAADSVDHLQIYQKSIIPFLQNIV